MWKYCYHLVFYLYVWTWAVRLLATAPWFVSWDSIWKPNVDSDYTVDLFATQIVWYIHCFVESLLLDRKRSDYFMMLLHHVMTVVLILGAHNTRAHRVGLLVLVNQDFTDIVINMSKIAQKLVTSKTVQTAILILLTISWFCTRVLALSMIVFRSYLNATRQQFFLVLMLGVLLSMQIIWSVGLVRITTTFLRQGVVVDTFEGQTDRTKAPAPGEQHLDPPE